MTAKRTRTSPVVSPELQLYLDRILATPRLGVQEERELMARWFDEEDRKAADRIIETHLRYVVAIALKYRNYPISMSDLVSEGTLGLLVALRKFDRSRQTRFVTYASFWIRAYILDLVIRCWHSGKLGTGPFKSKLFFKLRREHAKLYSRYGESPRGIEQMARRMGIESATLEDMLRRIEKGDLSLDQELSDTGGVTMKDMLRDEGPDPLDQVSAQESQNQVARRIHEALKQLDDRERYIVVHRLMTDDSTTLARLGEQLGVSRERARQIEVRARRKLRVQLSGESGFEMPVPA